jgi:hypothetical protein
MNEGLRLGDVLGNSRAMRKKPNYYALELFTLQNVVTCFDDFRIVESIYLPLFLLGLSALREVDLAIRQRQFLVSRPASCDPNNKKRDRITASGVAYNRFGVVGCSGHLDRSARLSRQE